MWARAHDQRGFTLVEVLIVIVIVAILALIVIPLASAACRRSQEAQLRADLMQLRDAIERFEGDTGAWPPQLADIVAASGGAISDDFDGSGGYVNRAAYKGPYLVAGQGDPLPTDPITAALDWTYDNTTGAMHSSSHLPGLNGMPYNEW